MSRLLIFIATVTVALAISASTAVADGCSCGNGGYYPQFVGCAYGQGTWDYGPGASPRFRQGPCQ